MPQLNKQEVQDLADCISFANSMLVAVTPLFLEGKVEQAVSDMIEQANRLDAGSIIYKDYDPKKVEALRLKAKALSGLNEFVVNSVKAEQLKSSFRENNLPSMGI